MLFIFEVLKRQIIAFDSQHDVPDKIKLELCWQFV